MGLIGATRLNVGTHRHSLQRAKGSKVGDADAESSIRTVIAMKIGPRPEKWLRKKARQGMRGYPLAMIAFYGPDDRRASKVAVSCVRQEGAEPQLRRWFSETGDARTDETILAEVAAYLREHSVHSVAMVDRIIGCPHEEGIDYPMGEACPQCHYWKGRDRWTGELDPA
jgi:hypothetical protein